MNSRAGCPTYSLSRGASSPLEYYSIMINIINNILTSEISFGGEDGIRAHVASLPNGFQDRLVMTASIPLRVTKSF